MRLYPHRSPGWSSPLWLGSGSNCSFLELQLFSPPEARLTSVHEIGSQFRLFFFCSFEFLQQVVLILSLRFPPKKNHHHHHHHQHLWSKVEQHFVQDVRLWRQIKPATKGDLNLEGMATRLGPSATPGLLRMMSVMWVTCHYPLVISNITMENHHF